MRYLFLTLIFVTTLAYANTRLGDLPVEDGSTVAPEDSFPIVDFSADQTKRILLDDVIHIPAIATPVFTGLITGPSIALTVGASTGYVLTGTDTLGHSSWQAPSGGGGGSGANITLSNLGTTAINSPLLPGAPATIDLGSASETFRSLYLAPSTSSIAGVVEQNGASYIHSYGDSSNHTTFFAGYNAGNFSMANANNKNNTGIGYSALNALTSGKDNVAVGANALVVNASGQQNIAVGSQGLAAHLSGNGSIAIGYQALLSDTNGVDNIAVGSGSLNTCDGGTDNIGIGSNAINALTNGAMNISIGRQSADSIVSGSGNTFIGDAAGSGPPNTGTGDTNNSTAIGTYAVAWTDNALVLGAVSGQGNSSIDTNVGIGTPTPNNKALLTLDTTVSSPSPGFVPLVMVPGTLIGSPISGAVENNGSALYYTNTTPVRRRVEVGSFLPIVSMVDAAYVILASDEYIRSGTTLTADRAATLPSCTANNLGEYHRLKNVSTQTHSVILTAHGSDTIEGAGTITVSPAGFIEVICAKFTTVGNWDIFNE